MTKNDLYAQITGAIIAKLETGVKPWAKPWRGYPSANGGRPLRSCGTPYTGINSLYLWTMADALGYQSRYWLTYKTAAKLGGQVRKGSKSQPVIYYTVLSRSENKSGELVDKKIPMMRDYRVFNADQIDGLPSHYYTNFVEAVPAITSNLPLDITEFFTNLDGNVIHGGDQACYSPILDTIKMPHMASFKTPYYYAATLAHEYIHWTAAKNRLDRETSDYAFEELIAELGAAYLGSDLGLPIEHVNSHASYIASWLKSLKSNPKALFQAAAKAEQAATWLKAKTGWKVEAERDMESEAA